ncbi:phage holin family protein [Frigidibacter sp. MR17.14]|uniref:phage holin family protein n=1 Tax=Frigidibacter sp. MR17.14 TaxID=3126509 RepID=UPI003012CA5E
MGGIIAALELKLQRAVSGLARSAALGLLAGIAALVALAFATAAGFIALSDVLGAAWAALIVALFYLAVALVAVAMLRRPAPPPPVALPLATAPPPPPLAEAFLAGLETGKSFGEGFRSGARASK